MYAGAWGRSARAQSLACATSCELRAPGQNNFAITASRVMPRQLFGLLRSPDSGRSLSFPTSQFSSTFSHLQIC
jgi:hypothetical protein